MASKNSRSARVKLVPNRSLICSMIRDSGSSSGSCARPRAVEDVHDLARARRRAMTEPSKVCLDAQVGELDHGAEVDGVAPARVG